MAQKTIVHLIDDVDGGQADETVTFSLDGVDYTIDLSSGNANELRTSLAEFIGAARRISSGRSPVPARVKTGGGRAENQAIREWARGAGHQISERGRIPAGLIAEYHQSHGAN